MQTPWLNSRGVLLYIDIMRVIEGMDGFVVPGYLGRLHWTMNL